MGEEKIDPIRCVLVHKIEFVCPLADSCKMKPVCIYSEDSNVSDPEGNKMMRPKMHIAQHEGSLTLWCQCLVLKDGCEDVMKDRLDLAELQSKLLIQADTVLAAVDQADTKKWLELLNQYVDGKL